MITFTEFEQIMADLVIMDFVITDWIWSLRTMLSATMAESKRKTGCPRCAELGASVAALLPEETALVPVLHLFHR